MAQFKFQFNKLLLGEDEIIIALLASQANGFEQTATALLAFTNDEAEFKKILNDFPNYHFTVSALEDENWNQIWESSFEPITIFADSKPFVHVRASFHPPFFDAAHEIIITPKMSFGTGHHATTSLVLENMSHINFTNKSIIDFGTGTGVLAILAEKLGALSILAIDNDEWSINNAQENIAVNNCNNISLLLAEEIPDVNPCDVLIANINLNIILLHLPKMHASLKENGVLLLSGMLVEDSKCITEALQTFLFTHINIQVQNNWIMVSAVKSK